MIDRLRRDEDGVALFSALGVGIVVLLLLSVTFTIVLANQRQAYEYADNNAALSAAESGLDDYLARLNRRPGYYSIATEDSPGDNPALDGWAPVTDSRGEFHIDVDASRVNSEGSVIVRSTGRYGDEVRTIETTFRPRGFLDFIYFTQYEVIDPELTGADPDECSRTHAEGRSDFACGTIRFVTGDLIRGPLHTNDAMVIAGDPVFEGEATTAFRGIDGSTTYSGCDDSGEPGGTHQLWRHQTGQRSNGSWARTYDSDPEFRGSLCWSESIAVPADNQTIQNQTTHSSPATEGCAYYGPTYIEFYDPDPDVNNDGRMRVRSPFSVDEPAGAIPKNDAACGDDGALASSNGADVPIPPNGVVYVDDNTDESCTASTHPLGLPRPDDDTVYDCNAGDVFVWGTVDGQVTVGASNNINVVWDLEYAGDFPDTDDLTGLVADENVQLYHPVDTDVPGSGGTGVNLDKFGTDSNGDNLPPFIPGRLPSAADATHPDPMIQAAIMAVRHSFRVQNFRDGEPYFGRDGQLSVRGAIAQYYRGAVGTSRGSRRASGYDKDYVYDNRLRYLSPPYFVKPGGDTSWEEKRWAELAVPDELPD